LTPDDLEDLKRAYALLESPNLAVRLGDVVGSPMQRVAQNLPVSWRRSIDHASHSILERLLQTAIGSLDPTYFAPPTRARQRFLCSVSGGVGGAFGLPGVLLELPVTTTLMLRTIAATAMAHGEDLNRAENRLACLQVFAFGGPSHWDDAAETGYYGVRLLLGHHFSVLAERVLSSSGGVAHTPAAVEFLRSLAARFGVVFSQKVALQMTPIVGAFGGAAVNLAFISHFESVATGHFIIRRLERTYGVEPVQAAYEGLREEPTLNGPQEERFSWWPERGQRAPSQVAGEAAAPPEATDAVGEAAKEDAVGEAAKETAVEPEAEKEQPATDLNWLLGVREHLRIKEHREGQIVLRFGASILGNLPELAGHDAEALWRGIPGLTGMKISLWRRTITFDYDPEVIDPSLWTDLVEGDETVARKRLAELAAGTTAEQADTMQRGRDQ